MTRPARSPRPGSKAVLAAIVFALAADLDFVPGLLVGQPALYHQGISHSVAFALAAGLLGAVAVRLRGWSAARRFALFTAAYGSHLVLDLLGTDRRPPFGLPLLWPMSDDTFVAPFSLLPGVRHAATTAASTTEWIAGILSPHNLLAVVVELLVAGALAGAALAWRRWRSSDRAAC